MRAQQIIDAYRGLGELVTVSLPFREARGILRLKKAIETELEAVRGYEEQLVEKYGGTFEGGKITFASEDNYNAFTSERGAFLREEHPEITLPGVDLSGHAGLLRLTASALEALDGIVKFEEGDNG